MSVENTTAEEAKSSLPVSNLDTTRQGESEELLQVEVGYVDGKNREVQETCRGVSEVELGMAENTIPEPVSNELRTWFRGLNAEERSAAASFADGAFLSSFLAFAAPWSGAASNQPSSKREVDWSSMVSVEEFEAKYIAFAACIELQATPKHTNKKTALGTTVVACAAAAEGSVEKEERLASSDGAKKDIGFRIEPSEDAGASMAAAPPPQKHMASSSGVDERLLRFAKQILDHVAIIFPSAVKHVNNSCSLSDLQPIVIVRPDFFSTNGLEELFLALEHFAGAQLFLPDKVEPRPKLNGSLQWIRRLSGERREDRSVPVYALLLARIGWAIGERFCSRKQQIQKGLSNNPEEMAMSTETECAITEQNSGPTEYESLLVSLFSHCRALCDLTVAMDVATLSTFVAPLAEACLLDNAHFSCESGVVEHVITTPLSWVLSACARSIDFHFLDNAVASSLQKMADHGHTADLEVSMATSISRKSDVVPTPSTQTKSGPGNGSSSTKKKKKKAKKKKNKKTAHGESQPGPHEPTTVSAVLEAEDCTGKVNQKDSKSASENERRKMSTSCEKFESQKTLETTSLAAARMNDDALLAETKSGDPEKLREEMPRAESVTTIVSIATSANSDDTDIDSGVPTFLAGIGKARIGVASVSRGTRLVAAPAPSRVPAPKTEVAAKAEEDTGVASTAHPDHHEDGDVWETVEVRGRNVRKKPTERSHHHHHQHHYHRHNFSRHSHHSSASVSHDSHNGNHKKSKNNRALKSRNKSVSRRTVREILFSIIDAVEDEAQKKRTVTAAAAAADTSVSASALVVNKVANSWTNGPPVAAKKLPASPLPPPKMDFALVVSAKPTSEKPSMRDIVAGKAWVQSPATKETSKAHHDKHLSRPNGVPRTPGEPTAAPVASDSPSKRSPAKRAKKLSGGTADQNTATTYQETVSAVSAASNARVDSLENVEAVMDRKSDVSPADNDEAPPDRDRVVSDPAGDSTSNPPLPTLLSPERANSATSSVASSLEVPHAARPHRHSATSVNVNDVGYHLLDVCDKLSRDMSLFMSRRALALSARRRERGAIIAALQDCVSAIWPGRGHVEEYGSCATQLDLPSSDIDVVVRGLDQNHDMANSSHSVPSITGSKSPGSSDSLTPAMSFDNSEEVQLLHQQFVHAYGLLPTHLNGERVVRLAADIEKQPWAVQVRSIPTASVPVIKILCDPSRLSLGSQSGDWMTKHQHLPAQAAAAAGKNHPQVGTPSHSEHGSYPQSPLLPWRGSDVMKGLLMLDVTFEGPEHGGIGSTEFSTRAVAEACAETGLPPDATPFVQVLMVLKELLAQRKLNEPYSGGLSSYALLLLVVALMRERAVIKEEIERVERQREAMVAAELDSMKSLPRSHGQQQTVPVPGTNTFHSAIGAKTPPQKQKAVPKKEASLNKSSETKPQTMKNGKKAHQNAKQQKGNIHQHGAVSNADKKTSFPTSSSWASIAKTTPALKTAEKAEPKREELDFNQTEKRALQLSKKPSFADAVAKSSQTLSFNEKEKQPNISTSNDCARPSTGKKRAETTLTVVKMFDGKPHVKTSNSETETPKKAESSSSTLHVAPPFYPQGYNDIVEVLCSGETTAGKLLMHFLLYYGQHFDALGTAIDISGKHERDYIGHMSPYSYLSPYIQRRTPGSIDPITGMLVVDPIVVYDPLEGSEHKNVARRCFAWNSVRWIFAQSYATLASAVERSATPPATPGGPPVSAASSCEGRDRDGVMYDTHAMGDLMDPSSPLLRCLLSF